MKKPCSILTIHENQSSREVGTARRNKHKLASHGSGGVSTGAGVDLLFVDSASGDTKDRVVTGPMKVEDMELLILKEYCGEEVVSMFEDWDWD